MNYPDHNMIQTQSTIKNIKINLVSIKKKHDQNSNQHKQESKSKIQRNKRRVTHFELEKSRDGGGVRWLRGWKMVASGARVSRGQRQPRLAGKH